MGQVVVAARHDSLHASTQGLVAAIWPIRSILRRRTQVATNSGVALQSGTGVVFFRPGDIVKWKPIDRAEYDFRG